MDEKMKTSIDSVLVRVKDPESGLSVSELDLVKRVRYSKDKKRLYIFTDFAAHRSGCITCAAIGSLISTAIMRDLEAEFNNEFPDLAVEFIAETILPL